MTQTSVLVLGLGIAGSSIAATLAHRGFRVTALEQFSPLHTNGSSHGDTRIYRRVPHEGPVYVEMAEISHRLWLQWNQLWRQSAQSGDLDSYDGLDLYLPIGGIDAGPPESRLVQSAETLCRQYHQPYELLTAQTLHHRHPIYSLPANWTAIYQPNSGIVRPDATRTFLHTYARAAGATLLHNTTVLEINPTPAGITIRTQTASGSLETHHADYLITTAGSWTSSLFPDLHLPLAPERRVLAWYQPQQSLPTNTPIFILDADGGWYGMPTPDGRLKLGHDKHLRQPVDRNSAPGTPASITGPAAPNAEDAAYLSRCIRTYFPTISPEPTQLASCIYTLTPDHHFLIDHHPTHPNILLFSPCSGHGFKFAPAYGQIAAGLLAGHPGADHPTLNLSLFGLSRTTTSAAARITRYSS